MISQASSYETPVERSGLVWTQTHEATLGKVSGGLPAPHQWRAFLDQLRPSSRPLVLWLRGRVWFGSEGRAELAKAIGSSKVALIVDHDIGRGLATALRWMGSDVEAYGIDELAQVDESLGLEPGAAMIALERLM